MCKPDFLSAEHNWTQVLRYLDITTNVLTSLPIFHEGLYHTQCFITIIVILWLEAAPAHEISRMAMMSPEKVELVGIELIVGDMGGRILFQLSKELVALDGILIINLVFRF
jgi:hypothetical protein